MRINQDKAVPDDLRSVPSVLRATSERLASSPPAQQGRLELPVAGVGASAGGLEAYKEFLSTLPPNTGIAYVLIPHLAPGHESLMVQLLSRCTALPVKAIEDMQEVKANSVYVIPPNNYVSIRGGILHLSGPIDRLGPRTALDWFLVSLAEDRHENAICIILSGTDSHGTPGLKVVKANGGTAIAQDPKTAKFPSMPENAIATGLVDYVLPASRMGVMLLDRFGVSSTYARVLRSDELEPATLASILALLRQRMNLDFRGYRENMLTRRIERRMGLAHLSHPAEYESYLRTHPDELDQLAKDIMISVTKFFREPDGSFEVLEGEIIPALIRRKQDNEPIRIWVAGCATGQEAYSIAILFMEHLAQAGKKCPLIIFASDLDEAALSFARLGVYPENLMADISPARLEQFFSRINEHAYRIRPHVRESITFAAHNLVSDPPYSTLDLISCRNVLIYLEPKLQERIIPLLHFALTDGGFLMLGPAEGLHQYADLFTPTPNGRHLYQRIGIARRDVPFPTATGRPIVLAAAQSYRTELRDQTRPRELMQRLLTKKYAPASVLTDSNGKILQYHGHTTLYLDLPSGEPSQNVLSMVRGGLRHKLRTAMKQAVAERRSFVVRASIQRGDSYVSVRSQIGYVEAGGYATAPFLLISFEDESEVASVIAASGEDKSLVHQLESELQGTREELEGTIEALRSAVEDLKSSAAEAMSMNEELQSANEELESSKEEMHSLNEELISANNQLQGKVEQLEVLNDDITNLINSTNLAALSLDMGLQIQWFTPATTAILNLLPVDAGRPITDIVQKVFDPDLLEDAQRVLDSLIPMQKALPRKEGRSWMRQILPYRTKNNVVKGVVITFIDITEPRLAEERLRKLTAFLMDSSDAIMVLNFSGQITAWNNGAERMYGYTEAEALKLNIAQLIPAGLRKEEFDLLALAHQARFVVPRESTRVCKDGTLREIWLTTRTFVDEDGIPVSVTRTERDLSEKKAVARIQHLATHDSLTGLPSRLLLDELASQALAYADRSETKVALLFIDLDHFKVVNDTRGHQFGDLVLQHIAKRLKSCVRGQDVVVRHGGDEFIAMLTGINSVQAAGQAAKHILASVARPYKIRDEEMCSTISIGISVYPDDASHLDSLVRNADSAMYRAKAQGTGTYNYFTPDMAVGVWDRHSLEYGLFRALEQQEFVLEYQPQVEVATGKITGAEALLRWQHPELGLIKPVNFISLLEDTGLIVPLGEWVMKTACTQVRAWHQAGLPAIQIAVNLSAVQISQLDFPMTVARVLMESQLEPKYLGLEITESALMRNIESSIIRLRQLRQMGIQIALDDFGTGYSSLSYLRQLPIDRLKMDVSFVRALTSDSGGDILVKAILSIAKSLNLRVLAEGVETREQLQILQVEGCDEIQGYYFSPPVTAEQFEAMLRGGRSLQQIALPCIEARTAVAGGNGG